MITNDDAFTADEFHIGHSGIPCVVWHRAGMTYTTPAGSYLLPIQAGNGDWWHITPATADRFHVLADCPLIRSDRSELREPELPLAGKRNAYGYDEQGYDEYGFDVDGFDREGYDVQGYDEYGRDAEGYDRDGFDVDGFDREGYDEDGYDSSGYDRYGDHYPVCESCDERCDADDLTTTLDDTSVCERCRGNYYTYCEDCDGYYQDDYADDHDHDSDGDGGCCDSPQLGFTVRNDGCDPLAAGTRITVTLPVGTIDAEGLSAISSYLACQPGLYDLAYYGIDKLGDEWQTRTGNYTRRLSRLAYQDYQVKLTQEVMSQVGVIARDHSNAVDVDIEVTRDLNQGARYFYHDSSCWWGSYSESRCALKTNGGFGLRSFKYGDVSGRAWVMPLKLDDSLTGQKFAPTFDTMTPDAFIVFNGYGDLSGYAAARIVAHMAGWTYRKIDFACEPMYVNAGGYLIAPEDVTKQYADKGISLSVDQHADLFRAETRELAHAQ